MDISDHGSDVASTVGGLGWTWIFDRFEVCVDRWIKIHRVALVEGVDLATWGDLDVRMRKDKLAQCSVESVSIYTLSCG